MKDKEDLNVRRYRVDDFQAGLKQIKKEVGDNAIIVDTSRLTDPAKEGNFEITVGVDPDEMPEPKNEPEKNSTNGYSSRVNGETNSSSPDVNDQLVTVVEKLAKNVQSLKSDLKDVKNQQQSPKRSPSPQNQNSANSAPDSMMKAFRTSLSKIKSEQSSTTFCQTITKIFESLKSNGVLEDHIERLLAKSLQDSEDWENKPQSLYDTVEAEMANEIQTLPPLWQTRCSRTEIAIFAGPTGVGKTTSIAKLAAHSKFVGHKNVGIICADTFRIGGLYQLETYADLVGVPTKSVSSFREFKGALNTFRDMDLILVDTRGQSPWTQNPEEDIDLRAYQSLGSADFEIKYCLCLSTSSGTRNLIDLAESYRDIRPMSLVFTKVDESRQMGSMLSTAMSTGLPISHVCDGPQVPDDIMSPTDSEIARWIQHGLSSSNSTLESQVDQSIRKMGA